MTAAVAFLLASAVVQATQCSSGGEFPSDGEPQSEVLLLQTKLQMNLVGGGEKLKCVLHVGPHKTGSSSLQSMLVEHAAMLQSDGWHQPSDFAAYYGGTKNMANIAFFLQEATPDPKKPIWQSFVYWVEARAYNRQNIVLSSEELDKGSVHIPLLQEALRKFHTTVVISYRPFFEWVPAFFREISNVRPVDILQHWLTPDMASMIGTGEMAWTQGSLFTDGLVKAYAPYFDDIRILDLNDQFLNTFVCSGLRAKRTCDSLSNEPHSVANVRFAPNGNGCMSQGGCLDRDVRTVLLDRTLSTAREVALLSHSHVNTNETELAQKLDALGLCFC